MKLDGSVEIEGTYPLSPTQQGMLFHSLYAQESGVDIEQMLCVLNEALDVDAFTECWNRLLGRHSALRASFRWEGLSEPLQDVQRSVTLPITIEDWRDLTGEQQQARLESYLRADRKRGFDLRQAPLMRLALFRLAESDYRLVWTFHHIVADGRSHFYILKEVFAFYDALSRGEELKLPAPRPYGEFIAWLQKQDFSQAETFWRNALQGFTGVNTLSVPPTEFTDLGGDERGEQELCLSSNVTQALSNLAQRHQLTLNTLVQGAWAILLSRYSGDQDVVFGIVRAGRSGTVEGAESMVGMFINTVPLRFKVSPTARLLDWLGGIRASNVALRPYEHTPLIKIQSWSDRPAGAPLFESLLVFDRYYLNSALQAQGGEWQARNFRLLEKTIYPLTLYGYGGEELRLKIAYDRRRFGDPTVARMLGHLATLLENMSSTPERTLAELPLVNDRECREILIEWNRTDAQYPDALCLHQLFEAQVERTPEAVAVVFEDQKLTYRELNQKANQLAHHLRQLGVGPDARVAICVERSLEMVIGLLGILKAGAAYVPLDPSYPKERLAFMLDDARVRLVLTQQRLLARVIEDRESRMDPRVRVVCLDTEWGKIARESAENPQNQTKPENLAYVIYTSGSTGRPKGVMVAHRNVVNFLTAMDASIDHEPPGVWLAVTSISFDISVLELFWTLARGFRVIIQGDNHLLSSPKDAKGGAERNIEFSLFYFASNENEDAGDKYRLLVEGAKFADRHGFSAVWTPERHFHAFGGLYPNPSVTSAALATVTRSLKLRAGSVVLPLQNPIRVAEEWAVVDNLSNGRVGVSFASGWHANDFVFAPENYAGRREIMVREIEVVRKLWRGDSVSLRDGVGSEVEVKIFPRPVQRELPIWITAAGSPDTFRPAGESGANLLTHLLGQDF
ncbi:MAG TPA: MupA/Atu3671 family FMN-dependent luciferase-like monooxygenase, partial [Candidatus Eisenbacteria bacterium]|nr:MupA/Atu3671 family FMN-dependent luciferase-like monooxygenase [Candidatus Eisenbacteria bacterium]